MGIQNTSGQLLKIGDKVKMNIEVIGQGDLDGVEIGDNNSVNYWRYMNQHPDEVYTITGLNLDYDTCPYELSGAMSGNTWASDELILLPEPTSRFEVIKNMTLEEMRDNLLPMLQELCAYGVPSKQMMEQWLTHHP